MHQRHLWTRVAGMQMWYYKNTEIILGSDRSNMQIAGNVDCPVYSICGIFVKFRQRQEDVCS